MRKHCGNCAVYDRKNMKHSNLCGKCVTEHFPNGKESDPSMWKPLPQTNADRIRAMSDEEMVVHNVRVTRDEMYYECSDGELFAVFEDAIEHEMAWLQAPAEED